MRSVYKALTANFSAICFTFYSVLWLVWIELGEMILFGLFIQYTIKIELQ